MDAIVLAGGKGTRMQDPLPKCLVVAHGKTILSHQLDYLLKHCSKVVLALGVKADQVISYLKVNYSDKPVTWVIEEEPLGTGGAIKHAMKECSSSRVLVLNADDMTDIDIGSLKGLNEHVICVANPRLPFGLVESDSGYASFKEKPLLESLWVSCGWYCFNRSEIFSLLPDKGSIEYDVFPSIKLKVHEHKGYWQTVNSKKDLAAFAETALPAAFSRNV